MSVPFDIGRFIIYPGRKIYGFLVTSKVKPGVLATISSILSKYNVTILYLSFSRFITTPTRKVTAIAFCDFTESTVSPENLVKEVEKLEFIEKIEIIKPRIDGFMSDYKSFPLKIRENRAVIIRDIGYKGLLVGIRKRFGSAAEAFLYYLGFEAGREYGKDHKKMAKELGIEDPAKIYDIISATMFNSVGYGRMETIKFDSKKPYALIRVHHSFECELERGVNKPYSHLVREMIAGVITELLGKEMHAEEIKCITKGDPYCEFEVIQKTQIKKS